MTAWLNSRTRSGLIVALLLSALVLAAVLALQAVASAQYHRATAERVLGDYARAAAQESAQRVSQDFEYYGSYPVFGILARLDAGRPGTTLPSRIRLLEGSNEYERRALGGVSRLFRLDFESGRFVFSDSSANDAALGWLHDTLPAHATRVYQAEWRSAALWGPAGEGNVFVYAIQRSSDDTPVSAYGFELSSDGTRALLEASIRRKPLLAPSLMRGIDHDSLVVVRLVDASDRLHYTSRADTVVTTAFAAIAAADPRLGGLVAHVALRPETAGRLIIGGLPKTRLPLILGLLALTAALIVIALLQLRRERDLTRLRTEFVSNVSHELRTPLAQIRMFAETLLLGRVRSERERQRSLQIIDKEARRLTHLVENVLQFSRAERRVSILALQRTALAELIREVLDGFAPATDARAARFRTDLEEHLAADVDRGAVQQMLVNLLDNAVKYGPAGQTVVVGLRQHEGVARMWVDDEGPGVPEGDRARVWERFARLETKRSTAIAGTGIGLSVVHDLTTQHGGRAWVETAPGGGARFVVELPGVCRAAQPGCSSQDARPSGVVDLQPPASVRNVS